MWNSTFFNVQILDVFSLEREKIYKNVLQKKPVTVKFIWLEFLPQRKMQTRHTTLTHKWKKKSLFILKLRSGFQIYYNVILTS